MPIFPLYRLSFLLLVFFLWGIHSCKDDQVIRPSEPEILLPREGSVYYRGESVRVHAETKPGVGFSHLEVYLDGTFMYESPGQETDSLIGYQLMPDGQHTLEVHAVNTYGNTSSATVSFRVENSLEVSDDIVSFQEDPVAGWAISSWSLSSPGKDDDKSLYSSGDHAYALTQKEFDRAGSISFYVKSGSGNLKFLLDGELKAKWFGQEDWGYYAYSVPAGMHVFRWECETEGTYLDSVVFTPGKEQHTPGEMYGGGTIFFLDSTGLHGLIAAFQDGSYNGRPEIPWGCYGLNILSGNRAQSTTDGAGNTWAIVQDCDREQIAARYCYELITLHDDSIQDDWYLPALNELQSLYRNRTVLEGLGGEYYWSSTSFSSNAASVFNFLDGSHHGAHRNIPNVNGPVAAGIHVRAIRKF